MRITLRAKRMTAGRRRLRVGAGRLKPGAIDSEEAEVEAPD